MCIRIRRIARERVDRLRSRPHELDLLQVQRKSALETLAIAVLPTIGARDDGAGIGFGETPRASIAITVGFALTSDSQAGQWACQRSQWV